MGESKVCNVRRSCAGKSTIPNFLLTIKWHERTMYVPISIVSGLTVYTQLMYRWSD